MVNRVVSGAAAGAIGGLAGAAVKQLCEAIVPPRSPGRESPPGVLAAKVVRALDRGDLTDDEKANAALAIQWFFSATASAAYGALVASASEPRFVSGVGFGLMIWAGLHEVALPLLGATPPLRRLPVKEQVNEFVTHAIFGATVEAVRTRIVRTWDGPSTPAPPPYGDRNAP